MKSLFLLRDAAFSLLYVHVIASHVFCLSTPPRRNPWLPLAGCLCSPAWHDHYHCSPLSICPLASQQHFTSSPLNKLLLPSPPPSLSPPPPAPRLRPPPASLLVGVTFALSLRGEGRTLIQSLTFPPRLSLSGVAHCQFHWQWISETKS